MASVFPKVHGWKIAFLNDSASICVSLPNKTVHKSMIIVLFFYQFSWTITFSSMWRLYKVCVQMYVDDYNWFTLLFRVTSLTALMFCCLPNDKFYKIKLIVSFKHAR